MRAHFCADDAVTVSHAHNKMGLQEKLHLKTCCSTRTEAGKVVSVVLLAFLHLFFCHVQQPGRGVGKGYMGC